MPGFVLTMGVHPAGSALPRHTHNDPTICYVLHGGFTEYSPGQAADCGVSTLKVTPAGDPHWNRFGTDLTRGLRIDVHRDRFVEVPALFRALDERRHQTGGRGGALAHRLVTELTAADAAGPIAAEGLALELVAELARTAVSPRGRETPAWLRQADEVIHERYRTEMTVGDIAAVVGVHPATLSRAYRRRYGCTVGERIRALRVEHAARALRESMAPLSEIAFRAGFYDQSHFTNVFRRHLGVTPGMYRTLGRTG